MNPSTADKLQALLSQGRLEHAAEELRRLDAGAAAGLFMSLPYDAQCGLFRALPTDLAATLVSHFPYYHAFVLLHTRSIEDLRAIVEKMHPDIRLQFFDELPEEAWQRLMDEISGALPAVPPPGMSAVQAPSLRAGINQVQVGKLTVRGGSRKTLGSAAWQPSQDSCPLLMAILFILRAAE